MKLFVERQHDRPNRVDLFAIHGLAVIGVDQLNFVAALRQDTDQFAQRPRDAIDLGKVRFRDQCDSHMVRRADAKVKRSERVPPTHPTRLAPTGKGHRGVSTGAPTWLAAELDLAAVNPGEAYLRLLGQAIGDLVGKPLESFGLTANVILGLRGFARTDRVRYPKLRSNGL